MVILVQEKRRGGSMADVESMLNDIPYLTALDSSESIAKSLYKKFILPDIR